MGGHGLEGGALAQDADHGVGLFLGVRQDQADPDLFGRLRAALLFLWKGLRGREHVQVRIEGTVEPVSAAEADAYFASRPRPSQVGAWASLQSQTLDSRETFEARFDAYEKKFEGADVPRPANWSGFRVVAELIEFWYGAEYRLHERQQYERIDGEWTKRMLYP